MSGGLGTESQYDEFIHAKDLIEKQLVYQNKPVGTKWMGVFGNLEINSYKSKSCCC